MNLLKRDEDVNESGQGDNSLQEVHPVYENRDDKLSQSLHVNEDGDEDNRIEEI